jgi:hypothetical protein
MIQRESLFGTYPSDRILESASERARTRGARSLNAHDVIWAILSYLNSEYEAALTRDTIPAPPPYPSNVPGYEPEPGDEELIGEWIGTEVEL